MASRQQELVTKAVARARSLQPGIAPDSVEVVELARGQAFVVVRTRPSGIVVLDRSGRLVRGRERLVALGRHLRSLELFDDALKAARLSQRRDHAERSIAFLRQASAGSRSKKLADSVAGLVNALGGLTAAIDSASAQLGQPGALRPTERTFRRGVLMLNEAASADRTVVLETRRMAAFLAGRGSARRGAAEERLQRWVVARLAAADLPFYHPEFEADATERYVDGFVTTVRAGTVGTAQ
jgi:hypothetical protein